MVYLLHVRRVSSNPIFSKTTTPHTEVSLRGVEGHSQGSAWLGYSKTRDPLLEDKRGKKAWRVIVPIYTRAQLTKPEDKAVAIYGLARLVQERTGDEYFAGLWKRDLIEQLLWRVITDFKSNYRPLPRPEIYRAPTFSWMSVDNEITTQGLNINGEFIAEIIGFHTEGKLMELAGDVRQQFIRLRGFLKKVHLWAVDAQLRGGSQYKQWYITLADEATEKSCGGGSVAMTRPQPEEYDLRYNVLIDTEPSYKDYERLYCMVIAKWENAKSMEGLVLEAEKPNEGTFKRIGYFCVRSGRGRQLLVPSSHRDDLPCDILDSMTGKCTIRIV